MAVEETACNQSLGDEIRCAAVHADWSCKPFENLCILALLRQYHSLLINSVCSKFGSDVLCYLQNVEAVLTPPSVHVQFYNKLSELLCQENTPDCT